MAVKMIRAYVVVDSCGMWVTRQFGSAKAAIKNLNKAREEAGDMNCTVVEIMTAYEVDEPKISFTRVTE